MMDSGVDVALITFNPFSGFAVIWTPDWLYHHNTLFPTPFVSLFHSLLINVFVAMESHVTKSHACT
jgi:hypothetical protein